MIDNNPKWQKILPGHYQLALMMQVGFFLLVLLLGGTLFPMYSVASSLAFDRAEGQSMVGISTWLLIAYSVGSIAGPIAVMLTDNLLGEAALAACILAVSAVTASVCLYRRVIKDGPSQHVPSAATMVPETSLEMARVAAEQSEEQLESAKSR